VIKFIYIYCHKEYTKIVEGIVTSIHGNVYYPNSIKSEFSIDSISVEFILPNYETQSSEKKPIWTDYYLNKYKWYRKRRKCTWYKHEFTTEALQLSITFAGTWWALYGDINRYSKVVYKEQ
jgi:hypothetical protein